MSLPYPAFLALAATLLVQVGALVWIFSARARTARSWVVVLIRVFVVGLSRFWLNRLRGVKPCR